MKLLRTANDFRQDVLDMKDFFRFVKIAMENQHQAVKEFDAWLRSGGAKQ